VPRPVLVDSNVILDVVTEDPKWVAWSADALERAAEASPLVINPLVLGRGRTMFDGTDSPVRLELTETRHFRNGKVFLRGQVESLVEALEATPELNRQSFMQTVRSLDGVGGGMLLPGVPVTP
jgi:hypothetical protein